MQREFIRRAQELGVNVVLITPRRPPLEPMDDFDAPEPDVLPLPAPGQDPTCCPVCGWSPCTEGCRVGLSQYDLEELDLMWRDWGAADGEAA